MLKINFTHKPVLISTLITMLSVAIISAVYFMVTPRADIALLIYPTLIVLSIYLIFNTILWIKKRRKRSVEYLDTEEEALQNLLAPLLQRMKNKPLYLLIGTKNSGKTQFLLASNTIQSADKTKTVKNDFFEWYESDKAVYIKPNQRLLFQEMSGLDATLWEVLISEIINNRPRKPFNGCLFFVDLEFLIVNEEDQIESVLALLCSRLEYICKQTSSSFPIYLMMSKLDKLNGFKEYIQFSSMKTTVEFLAIQLKDAKGAMLNYFDDSFGNLVQFMEASALDASSDCNSEEERRAIITFPKQFELCQTEIRNVLERLSSLNKGSYILDIREMFFISNHQGGRKYSLLAKSCSNYFNIPIIASGHSHLSETPYFTRFLIDRRILSEADFAGENKTYLKKIQRNSMIALMISFIVLLAGGGIIFLILKSNILVMNQLMLAEEKHQDINIAANTFESRLINANHRIKMSFDAWFSGNYHADKEIISLNISYLDETTKLAYQTLLRKVDEHLMPVIEEGYRLEIVKNQYDAEKSLALLKGYLMLKEPNKRDLQFLQQQTKLVLDNQLNDNDLSAQTMTYIDAYFRTKFKAVDINMNLVRATRRQLLSHSNIDAVYSALLQQAKDLDLGSLHLARAVGFDFNNVFIDQAESANLQINKVYTDTGFSTFFRPNVDLMSKDVIADNWVLGLSRNTVPTENEQETFKREVRKRYTDDYINHWRNALSELKIKRFKNIGELANAIDLISGPSSPMTTVLKLLYSNSQFSPLVNPLEPIKLVNPSSKNVADVVDIAQVISDIVVQPDYVLMARVEQAFRLINRLLINETPTSPTPWDEIIAALSHVRTYVKDIVDSPNAQMSALIAAKRRMNSSETDPILRLKQIAQKSPEPVRTWLMSVVNQTWSVIIDEASIGIQTHWYSNVYRKFIDIGLHKYPFNPAADSEISVENFELLFSSGGIIEQFIKDNLAPFYDTVLWLPKRVDGEIMPLSPKLLVQLKNYNIIRDTLINRNTNKLHVPFNVKVIDLDSSAIRATIKIADTSIHYYQGPSQIKEIVWPPQSGDNNISITIQDVTDEGKQHVMNVEGQWAIFRLFGNSVLTNVNDDTFFSDITVSGRALRIQVTPLVSNNPFELAELTNFTLPEKI